MRSALMTIVAMFALGCGTVSPGTVVLAVDVCNGNDGTIEVMRGGRYFDIFSPCTDYYWISTREHQSSLEGITFAGRDGQAVGVTASVKYAVGESDDDVKTMTRRYGYDLTEIVGNRVRTSTKNALNMCAAPLSVEEIYGPRKEELFKCAELKLQEEFNPNGLKIAQLTLDGAVSLPEQVLRAMELSTAATQNAERVRRELESTEAEGRKTVAAAEADAQAKLARAHAEAEANRVLAESITPALLRLRELEIEEAKAAKWDGRLPAISGGSSTMILDVGSVSAARN